MDTDSLTIATETEPLPVPLDRLFRVPEQAYRGMVEHGLFGADEVALEDGLLVCAVTNGHTDLLDRLYRMPLDVHDEAANLGFLGPSDRIELLDGLLVKKMTKGNPHIAVTKLIAKALDGVVAPDWHIGKEDPVALAGGLSGRDSEPEPDVTVVRGGIRDYLSRKPGPADTALVVEVGESSLREDHAKLSRYAWAGIPTAWIINLNDRTIEVHTHPTGPVAPAKYQEMTIYRDGDEVPVVLDGRAVGRIAAADLLP